MSIKNKVIIIMGASSGIGAATTNLLAEKGAKLIIAARRLERLEALKLSSPDAEISVKQADVTDFEQVQAVIDFAKQKYGKIDVLYNNAGIMPTAPLSEGRRDEWQRMLNINIMGVLNGIAATLPIMKQQQSGHIIVTDSVAGHHVLPGAAVYSGTKFAIRAIMDGLRQEEAENNIKTTMISPGSTGTELFNTINNQTEKKNAEDFFKEIDGLQPEQIATAVAYAVDTSDNMSVSDILIRPTKQSI
nr:SDR family oxidoreductase [Agrilactobacillus yilanensis]